MFTAHTAPILVSRTLIDLSLIFVGGLVEFIFEKWKIFPLLMFLCSYRMIVNLCWKFYGILFTLLLIFCTHDVWTEKIWPEIRLPQPDAIPYDQDFASNPRLGYTYSSWRFCGFLKRLYGIQEITIITNWMTSIHCGGDVE